MFKGNHRIAEQRGRFAVFAVIDLQVSELPGERAVRMDLSEGGEAAIRWEDAIKFGISYAIEQMPKRSVTYNVAINAVDWAPIDTTSVVVALATAWAFWNAIGFEPSRGPSVDLIHESLTFPKQAGGDWKLQNRERK